MVNAIFNLKYIGAATCYTIQFSIISDKGGITSITVTLTKIYRRLKVSRADISASGACIYMTRSYYRKESAA